MQLSHCSWQFVRLGGNKQSGSVDRTIAPAQTARAAYTLQLRFWFPALRVDVENGQQGAQAPTVSEAFTGMQVGSGARFLSLTIVQMFRSSIKMAMIQPGRCSSWAARSAKQGRLNCV
jgi:hypothetical protein